MKLEGKVAAITGGTAGLGRGIAEAFLAEGAKVALFARNPDKGAKVLEELNVGDRAIFVAGDVMKQSDVEGFIDHTVANFGTIDILVNNAGITQDSSFRKMTEEQWHEVIDTNLNGVFNLTRNVLPLMLENQYGRIISISSINGRKGQFGQANYAATKSALYGFSKSIAQEVAKKNITVNTISPGYIDTHMLATVGEEIMKAIIAEIPVGRLGRPEEIAEAIAFLASEHAAFITGANLDANGGQYM